MTRAERRWLERNSRAIDSAPVWLRDLLERPDVQAAMFAAADRCTDREPAIVLSIDRGRVEIAPIAKPTSTPVPPPGTQWLFVVWPGGAVRVPQRAVLFDQPVTALAIVRGGAS